MRFGLLFHCAGSDPFVPVAQPRRASVSYFYPWPADANATRYPSFGDIHETYPWGGGGGYGYGGGSYDSGYGYDGESSILS